MDFSDFFVRSKNPSLPAMKWTLLWSVQKLKALRHMSVVLFSAQNPLGPKKSTENYTDLCCFPPFKTQIIRPMGFFGFSVWSKSLQGVAMNERLLKTFKQQTSSLMFFFLAELLKMRQP